MAPRAESVANRNPVRRWGSTRPGRFFTRTGDWSLELQAEKLTLTMEERHISAGIDELQRVASTPGMFWAAVEFEFQKQDKIEVDGIPNDDAFAMCKALDEVTEARKRREQEKVSLQKFAQTLDAILVWAKAAVQRLGEKRRWITRDLVTELLASRPAVAADTLKKSQNRALVDALKPTDRHLYDFWAKDLKKYAVQHNEAFLAEELVTEKSFFEIVESRPLTSEQARAVVCMDNRMLLVASAGSGKTSTIVAKAAYAVKKEMFAPAEILILSYNRATADEIQNRIVARFKACGLDATGISANTFHAFGLQLIGAATGKKPSVAKWADQESGMADIVETLKAKHPDFARDWDLFRHIFGQDLGSPGEPADEAKENEFVTLKGESVKSRGEQIIADWLFYNGVEYEYERRHPQSTADSAHGHYHPDFYLPAVDAYLEHWALNAKGKPPAHFVGYAESMKWKKRFHAQHGSTLLETTFAGILDGSALRYLEDKLTELGLVLEPDPERVAEGRPPIEDWRLCRTFRSFLTHVKNNRLKEEELREAVTAGRAGGFLHRQHRFLDLFARIYGAWQARLAAEDGIDFEDMINIAAGLVEDGKWTDQHRLLLLDEFQDCSRARARLIKALLQTPDRYVFAVGDDWQSINRFSGADLSAMTGFRSFFGDAELMKLERTFRCPQSLCDISSRFIQKNPEQLEKKVVSSEPGDPKPVRIKVLHNEKLIKDAVSACIDSIAHHARHGSSAPPTVFVLGRYRRDREYYLSHALDRRRDIRVSFMTIHAAKGLEADHVIIPAMIASTAGNLLGFPSGMIDDPVLQLAMPAGDAYPYSEERRLFYVALTRARRLVHVLTVKSRLSTFVTELVRDADIQLENAAGHSYGLGLCPACKSAQIVQRQSTYGVFFACDGFPACRYKAPPNWRPARGSAC